MSAPFDDAYAICMTCGQYDDCEPMKTIDPPRALSWGIAASVMRSVPNTLTSNVARQPSQSASSRPPNSVSSAAQLHSESTPPKRETARSTRASQSSGLVTSVTRQRDPLARGVDRVGRRLQVRLGAGPDDDVRALAPAASAISRPSPGPTPDTTIVVPSSSMSVPPVARFDRPRPQGISRA